ncbi:MAG TPA: hypothetical protein PKU78_06755, partial [Candidatus Dojkabacteria bacterium]|nr:hypothetical protein [Candidatus Dojkabacteria bacterium]
MYFVRWAEGSYELWKSDGTSNGTLRVTTLATDSPSNSTFLNATEFNSVLYFSNFDAINGEELWRTDGTEQGTYIVKDINPGISSSMPFAFQNTGNELMFYADDGTHGRELWKTDGTPSGTVLVKDIYIGPDGSKQDPFGLMSLELNNGGYNTNMQFGVNDLLYFSAYDCVHGNELWVSDGTTLGTRLLKDINESGNFKNYNSSYYLELAEYNGFMYFSAEDTDGDKELWRTDGTESGTTMVKNINTFNTSDPNNFYYYKNELYFTANTLLEGNELWKTDGSQDGTVLVHDINPITGSAPNAFN